MEKLLLKIYTIEMGQEPRKPLLGEMLADNQFSRKIERRILSRMNAIRDMGNLGPHGEPVEPSDAAKVLDDLCEVMDWYLGRYSSRAKLSPQDCQTTAADQSSRGDAARLCGPLKPYQGHKRIRVVTLGVATLLVLSISVIVLHRMSGRGKPGDESGKVKLPTGASARLEVTDIIVNAAEISRGPRGATLDFRVINRGQRTLSLSRVRFELVDVRDRKNILIYDESLRSSAKSALDISDLKKKGDQAEVIVSHVLAGDKADRFAVLLKAANLPANTYRFWSLRPILVTSEGEVEAPIVKMALEGTIRKPEPRPLKEKR
jgi:hypothetical protein